MKILHIDETFHPNFGYQCNPLAKFQSMQGNEVYIISPTAEYIYPVYHSFGEYGINLDQDDQNYENLTGVKIVRVDAKGYICGRLNYYKNKLFKVIDLINPDVIMVHCIETLTAVRVMKHFKNKYPMIFDSHMLAMASQNKFSKLYEKIYKIFVTSTIKKEKFKVIKTQNDDYVTSHLGVPSIQTRFISFGTDTELFKEDKQVKEKFLTLNNLPMDTFVIVSTGKLTEAKGGLLLANALKDKFETSKEIVIVIVANFENDYEKDVKKVLDLSKNKILFFPVQHYMDLPKFYQIADLTIFPKQCSMSFYDAQSCGVPVISENVNINIERNSHGNGFCFESGNYIDLKNKINYVINLSNEELNLLRKNSSEFVRNNYSYDLIAKQYTEEMINAINVFKEKNS